MDFGPSSSYFQSWRKIQFWNSIQITPRRESVRLRKRAGRVSFAKSNKELAQPKVDDPLRVGRSAFLENKKVDQTRRPLIVNDGRL